MTTQNKNSTWRENVDAFTVVGEVSFLVPEGGSADGDSVLRRGRGVIASVTIIIA
jgi:hypothetical protein